MQSKSPKWLICRHFIDCIVLPFKQFSCSRRSQRIQRRPQRLPKRWQVGPDGSPDGVQVDQEIAVGQDVAHANRLTERDFRMGCDDIGMVLPDVVRRLADDL